MDVTHRFKNALTKKIKSQAYHSKDFLSITKKTIDFSKIISCIRFIYRWMNSRIKYFQSTKN